MQQTSYSVLSGTLPSLFLFLCIVKFAAFNAFSKLSFVTSNCDKNNIKEK